MRCPNCGAFAEEGRKVCFMCGANLDGAAQQQGFNQNQNNNSDFSTGMPGSNNQSNFNNEPRFMNNRSNYEDNRPSYRDAYDGRKSSKKKTDMDIFDFYAKYKTIIKFTLFTVILLITYLIVAKVHEVNNEPIEKTAIFGNLYFEVDESFSKIATNGNASVTYVKSGATGSDCSIVIMNGTGVSNNHVKEFQESRIQQLAPAMNEKNAPLEPLKEFVSQKNEVTINGAKWYYLNLYYRESLENDFTNLRYKYLTAVDNAYFYDIELMNVTNDKVCSAQLDNFVSSLEFLKK